MKENRKKDNNAEPVLKGPKGQGAGFSRRVFINRGLATAGGAAILANAKSWPAWADVMEFEGTHTRMGQLAYDPETKSTWQSYVKIEVEVEEIDTEWGPTKATSASDSVMVKGKEGRGYGSPVNLSSGLAHAKLEPRLDARAGRVAVVWCGSDPDTREWSVHASYFDDQGWTGPMEVAGGMALHPDVALDPASGRAFVAYEDWKDKSIKLAAFDGKKWGTPVKISEAGYNYRPHLIVTDGSGKHGGKIAVVWDSYRDLQYDIHMRLISQDGSMGEEMRVTRCARWDSMADVIEDKDHNIWVAWVRASNELSEFNAMRNVHARFWDGERWLVPSVPEKLYNGSEFIHPTYLSDHGAKDNKELRRALGGEGREEGDGRVSWYSVCWFPTLQVDDKNRVYVFYRESDPLIFPLYSHLDYRVYEGDKWSGPRRLKLGRGANITRMMWGLSVAVKAKEIEAIWEQGFVNNPRVIKRAPRKLLAGLSGPMFHPWGEDSEETLYPGWKPRETMRPAPEMEVDGERHFLIFGDTHAHSWTSDGADPADYYYHYARDFARLDYFGLSDHDFRISNTPGIEAYIAFLPKVFSEDDFICFQGYEFTSGAKGHRCVVFEGDDKPTLPHRVFTPGKGDKVVSVGDLSGFIHKFGLSPDSRVMVSAHNMFDLGNDFTEYDESIEPLYDVMSQHIAAEKTLEEYVKEGVIGSAGSKAASVLMKLNQVVSGDAVTRDPANGWYSCWRHCLDASLPLGAYGNSDTHAVCGLGWITSGLWVRAKNRKAIFDAMFERRSIALDNLVRNFDVFNTFPFREERVKDTPVLRMDVRFWADDHFMGARPKLAEAPLLRASVKGHNPDDAVRSVTFVKNGREVHVARGGGDSSLQASWKDDHFLAGKNYYYARVEFESGNQGYSSPVFVNY